MELKKKIEEMKVKEEKNAAERKKEVEQKRKANREKNAEARKAFHIFVTTVCSLVKRGGIKNIREAEEMIEQELLNQESHTFARSLTRNDLAMRLLDVHENDAVTKKFEESKPFLRSYERTIATLESADRIDKNRPKTGINSYSDLFANYC